MSTTTVHPSLPRGLRRLLSALTAVAVAFASLLAVAAPAAAALGDDGQVTLDKTVATSGDGGAAEPGDIVTVSLRVGCDDNPCIDAAVTDALPAQLAGFTVQSLTLTPSALGVASLTGCSVGGSVTSGCVLGARFTAALGTLPGGPVVGLPNTTANVVLTLVVPSTLTPDWPYAGQTITNTATATATNSTPATDSADLVVDVPVLVGVDTTKAWAPVRDSFAPGRTSTVTTSVANTSNTGATSLVLQDPTTALAGAAQLAADNPFRYVDLLGLCTPSTLPQGADRVQVDAYVLSGGVWIWTTGTPAAAAALPAGVSPNGVGGLRYTYTSTTGATIAAAGTPGSQCLTLAQRSTDRRTGTTLTSGFTATNTATGTVQVPGQTPATDSASAGYTVAALDVAVSAGKAITPDQVAAGGTFSTSVTARNDSTGPLDSFTISEPGPGSSSALFSGDLAFAGFTAASWPSGATTATVTYDYADGTSSSADFTSGTPPGPRAGTVTGFRVVYTGPVAAGATAGLTFGTTASSTFVAAPATSTTVTNVVGVSGTNAAGTDDATATDTVAVYRPVMAVELDKSVRPALVAPGGTTVVGLAATSGSSTPTVNPTRIVVEDVLRGADADFWDAFDATEVSFTDVPAGATLTVEYLLGGTWHTLTAAGPGLLSAPVPAGVTGLRFTFENPAGFAQGTTVQPNVVFTARSTTRQGGRPVTGTDGVPTPYENAATTTASGVIPGTTTVLSADDDDTATASVVDTTGNGLLPVDKRWVTSDWSTDLASLASQSGALARTAQSWGVTTPGWSRVVLQDAPAGQETSPASTVYQAFDLTWVRPITYVQDPLLRWDTVSAVELFYGGAWHPAGGVAGRSWMDATGFTGYWLTTAEAAATTGVRLTVVENTAARRASTDPTRPAPGSGVAWSATARPSGFLWQLRSVPRMPSAATGDWVTATSRLNTATPGVVGNTIAVTATPATGSPVTVTDDDTVTLIDRPANVSSAKTMTPNSLVVPAPGMVPASAHPTATWKVTAQNTSSARAWYLRVADPCDAACVAAPATTTAEAVPDPAAAFAGRAYDAATNPFERFTLTQLVLTAPAAVPVDTSVSRVALWHRAADGTLSTTTTSVAAAAGLTAAQLADVVGVAVTWSSTQPWVTGGLIPSGQNLTTTMTTRLRDTLRSDPGTPVTAPATGLTVRNTSQAQTFDPVLSPTGRPSSLSPATQTLSSARLGVVASKQISPATLTEPQRGTPVTVALGARQGTATAAPTQVTLTDTDAGFWGSFALTGLGTVTLPLGADRVRVDLSTDGGATWVTGTAGPSATLPAVASLAAVTGVRVVFDRADGAPLSATVPPALWSASAALTTVLRESVVVGETGLVVADTVVAEAANPALPSVSDDASAEVAVTPGVPAIDVAKDPDTRVVEPGVSTGWTLRFTNTGTSYLDVLAVTDRLGASLIWDGTAPVVGTSAGGLLPVTGLEVSTRPGALVVSFPEGSRMAPGETYTIRLGLILEPGLSMGARATNSFVVDTAQTFAAGACTNTSGNGQGVLAGLTAGQCGTSNWVTPQTGALLLVTKGVVGSRPGAVNTVDPSLPCVLVQGFYRNPCAANTAAGGTDTWELTATNTGTLPYGRLVLVDPLPAVGDRMLATGAQRNSQFRPVLDGDSVQVTAPAGASSTWQVTTSVGACMGTSGAAVWPSDPTCEAATWVDGALYTGDWAQVTALRVIASPAAGQSLAPGAALAVTFTTTNTPLATADAVSVTAPVGAQLAWNQPGGVADLLFNNARIARAPQAVAVRVDSGPLEITKVASGPGADFAPESVLADVACAVAGAPVDLGESAVVSVPVGGSAVIRGIPLGSSCTVTEQGDVGEFGEASRDPSGPMTVEITEPADESGVTPIAQVVSLDNRYEVGALRVTKLRVGSGADIFGDGPFTVRVACTVPWTGAAVVLPGDGVLILSVLNDFTAGYDDLPAGARCVVVETEDGGAVSVTYEPSDGAVTIPAGSTADVTVTNEFVAEVLPDAGPGRPGGSGGSGSSGSSGGSGSGHHLAATGADGVAAVSVALLGLALLVVGAALQRQSRRRR